MCPTQTSDRLGSSNEMCSEACMDGTGTRVPEAATTSRDVSVDETGMDRAYTGGISSATSSMRLPAGVSRSAKERRLKDDSFLRCG
jgi:hypothetical protein